MDLIVEMKTNSSAKKTKRADIHRLPSILDVILFIVFTFFVFSAYVFAHRAQDQLDQTTVVPNVTITTTTASVLDERRRTKTYYDYEAYPSNYTKRVDKSRRYIYVDLGCFDGRDIDYFVHFHTKEISSKGTMVIIAFEPDPINLSACRAIEQRHPQVNQTVIPKAVWTSAGRVSFATEKGQRSKIDPNSMLTVDAVDFSQWARKNFVPDDYVYLKLTVEGAEIPLLEKMVEDSSLALIDYLDVEWNDALSPDFEPRRVSLECMFDNFGMDFLYMINPVDLRHAYNAKESFSSVPKDKSWCVRLTFLLGHTLIDASPFSLISGNSKIRRFVSITRRVKTSPI